MKRRIALEKGAVPGPVDIVDYNGSSIEYTQFQLTAAEDFIYTIDQKLGVT
ncbi:MAG TPA: hypothetical protein VFK06_14470 [Candidatus Angelobacter sp.]|nr:hypothetical protein [Candidatus Angelobacter sp.]